LEKNINVESATEKYFKNYFIARLHLSFPRLCEVFGALLITFLEPKADTKKPSLTGPR
jgi:hypothetical protein